MTQPQFNFSAPYHGRSPQATHASLSGARVARVTSQANRMLVRYLELGPLTDHALAVLLGLPEGRISARRASLMDRGLVAYESIVAGEFGAKNCRWQLTAKGAAVARTLATETR